MSTACRGYDWPSLMPRIMAWRAEGRGVGEIRSKILAADGHAPSRQMISQRISRSLRLKQPNRRCRLCRQLMSMDSIGVICAKCASDPPDFDMDEMDRRIAAAGRFKAATGGAYIDDSVAAKLFGKEMAS